MLFRQFGMTEFCPAQSTGSLSSSLTWRVPSDCRTYRSNPHWKQHWCVRNLIVRDFVVQGSEFAGSIWARMLCEVAMAGSHWQPIWGAGHRDLLFLFHPDLHFTPDVGAQWNRLTKPEKMKFLQKIGETSLSVPQSMLDWVNWMTELVSSLIHKFAACGSVGIVTQKSTVPSWNERISLYSLNMVLLFGMLSGCSMPQRTAWIIWWCFSAFLAHFF